MENNSGHKPARRNVTEMNGSKKMNSAYYCVERESGRIPARKASKMMVSRRALFHILPVGAASCLGCAGAALCAAQSEAQTTPQTPPSGPSAKADMTWEQVFNLSYRGYAHRMKRLSSRIGDDPFLKMLREVSSEAAVESSADLMKSAPARDLATFTLYMKAQMTTLPIYRAALVWDTVEQSTAAFEIHVAQCLWAKTFRAQDAAEIGYATICYPDYAMTTAFNPKLKMIRSKTLMQGHDCCNHRWVTES